jgi:hypothetical protein
VRQLLGYGDLCLLLVVPFLMIAETISCSLLGFFGIFGAGGGGEVSTIWVKVSLLSIKTIP